VKPIEQMIMGYIVLRSLGLPWPPARSLRLEERDIAGILSCFVKITISVDIDPLFENQD